jgi:small conductance mechanosensitive channel
MDFSSAKLDTLLDKFGFNLVLLARVALIVAAAFVLERFIRLLLRRAYAHSQQVHEDATRYRFLKNATRFIVGLIALAAIIYSIPSFKHIAVTLFAGAGILVAIIGLAAQGAFSNIISGVFIVAFKPFRVGDQVSVGGHTGVVEDITLRHTVIRTLENRRVIMPNSKISDETIINSTIGDAATFEFVVVTVSYECDLDRAIAVLQEEAMQHPSFRDRRTAGDVENGMPPVPVRVIALADNGVTLRAGIWADDAGAARLMHFDLLKNIKQRFDREGIVIPYPHRVIVNQQQPVTA